MKKIFVLIICLAMLLALHFSSVLAVNVVSGEIGGSCEIALPPEFGYGIRADGWFVFYPDKDVTFLKCIGVLPASVAPPAPEIRLSPAEVGSSICWYSGMTTGNFFTDAKPDGKVVLTCKFK